MPQAPTTPLLRPNFPIQLDIAHLPIQVNHQTHLHPTQSNSPSIQNASQYTLPQTNTPRCTPNHCVPFNPDSPDKGSPGYPTDEGV